ncbi:MAG TPA: T9SS type A sorting domain-containing protein [Bacteroidia bacterium]|nr:T9SS type A sorting domain-containing protein [Bacteroidia bacterium]
MNKTLFNCIVILLLASVNGYTQEWTKNLNVKTNPDFYDMQKAFNDYYADKIIDWTADGEYNHFKRWEAFMEPRVYPSGKFFNPAATFIESEKNQLNKNQSGLMAANWTPLGPQSGSMPGIGRVDCIVFDPVNNNTMWVGAASGGIWKSPDLGVTWLDMNAGLPVLSIADIAINPDNTDTMYAATGDGFGYTAFANIFWGGSYSVGVVKSVDGGASWNVTGLSFLAGQREIINRLIINPVNPDILIAAGSTGIQRSADAGATWTNVLANPVFYDVEFNTSNPDTVYAATGTGIYRSSDAGINWSFMPGTNFFTGRVAVETTPANPNVIYAMDENNALIKTTNGGLTWTAMTDPTCFLFGYYDCILSVSPTDENTLFAAGQSMCKSINGGVSWTLLNNVIHVDHHAVEFLPGSNFTVFAGSDGGIHFSANQGTSWTDLTYGLQITQFYRLGCSATNAGILFAGAQDNGTRKYNSGSWSTVGGADGMEVLVDHTNQNIVYKSTQNGTWSKSINGGNTFSGITPGSGAWVSPMVMHPTSNVTLFYGSNTVRKSVDSGNSWASISTALGGSLISLAVSQSNPNYIYAATYTSISRTINGGTAWTNITGTLPAAALAITYIAISATDPDHVWVTFSGYSAAQRVYETTNGGTSWASVSANLPAVPVNCIVYDNSSTNDAVYCGTDLGVYYMDNSTGGWQSFNDNLPNVIVNELEIQYTAGVLRAATYGRGIWETPLNDPTGIQPDIAAASTIALYPNPGNGLFYIDINSSTPGKVQINVFNLIGEKIKSVEDNVTFQKQFQVDLEKQPAGLYILEVKTDFETRIDKVIVNH